MKIFHCTHCQYLIFFESVSCLNCGHDLAYLPDEATMVALESDARQTGQAPGGGRLCRNYLEHDVCNWAIAPDDPHDLCVSCRTTEVIPDLADAQNVQRWFRAESAKRRLIVNLTSVGLPIGESSPGAGDGLRFEFKAPTQHEAIMTGHQNGIITLNVAEADDAERERVRAEMQEQYRTVLGHLRHESGHYYWDRLIAPGERLEAFRAMFGDERADYAQALQQHYASGPVPDWQSRYVSAYAAAHPWEDWAETWAHYLHIIDTLETAAGCGLTLKPKRPDEPALALADLNRGVARGAFDAAVGSWFSVTYLLNSLSRGLGLSDPYPFVLSEAVIEKLRFVHDTVADCRHASSRQDDGARDRPVAEAA